jgi:hypothetical protein
VCRNVRDGQGPSILLALVWGRGVHEPAVVGLNACWTRRGNTRTRTDCQQQFCAHCALCSPSPTPSPTQTYTQQPWRPRQKADGTWRRCTRAHRGASSLRWFASRGGQSRGGSATQTRAPNAAAWARW